MLDRAVFSYADVPYRIKPYEDILADPAETIVQSIRDAAGRHQLGASTAGVSLTSGLTFLSRLFRFGRRR